VVQFFLPLATLCGNSSLHAQLLAFLLVAHNLQLAQWRHTSTKAEQPNDSGDLREWKLQEL
jgi:hypothetical protein